MFLALLPLLLQTETIDPAKDASLQKPIDLDVVGLPLPAATKELAGQLGVPVEAVMNLADLKVTMICHQQSASSMMQAVADVLDCEWTKDQGVYRLRMGREIEDQRKTYLEAENRLLKSEIEDTMKTMMRSAPPEAQPGRRPPGGGESNDSTFAEMLSSLSSNNVAGFWRGDPITWAPTLRGGPRRAATVVESRRLIIRFDPYLYLVKRSGGAEIGRGDLVPYPEPPESLAKLPFAKVISNFGESEQPDDKRLAQAVTVPQLERDATHYVPAPTMDDAAEAFFKGTDYPIVCDSFQTPLVMGQVGSGAEFTTAIEAAGMESRISGAVLEARHRGFWRLRTFEVPTALRVEYSKMARTEPLTLAEYALFCARLTPSQASGLSQPNLEVLPFDPAPLQQMMPALRLYAVMDSSARSASASGISAAQLSGNAQSQFTTALLMGALQGLGGLGSLSALVSGDLRNLGVISAETSTKAATGNQVGSREFRIEVGSDLSRAQFRATVRGPRTK